VGYLPAELWSQSHLDATPELLRVAGLVETAQRLNLLHAPFNPDEARIVRVLLESSRPDEPDFASHLSAETDSPPNMTAAEESEQGAAPMPRARPSRTPGDGQPTAAPRTVWTVKPHVGDLPKPLESSAKSATDAQRVASVPRALRAHVEGLQSDMPHATAAISPNGFASLQRLHVNLHMVLLDDLETQEAVFQQWLEIAESAADDATAHGYPSTTLVAELTATFDRTVAKLINKHKLGPGSPLNHGGLFDSVFGLVRKGEAAALVVAKHFTPPGKAAATALHHALDLLDFTHGGGLNLPYAVNALVSAISATEESGVAIDAPLILARIEAKIAISSSEMVPLVTEAGTPALWAVWANDLAKAGALRGAAPVNVEDIHDLTGELTALAISQSKQQQSRAQAIAAGRAAGAQEAPHDDTAARVNNVSALSSSSELCSTAGCGKTIRSYFGVCKAGHIQPGFLQCRE
jgi:hypothetical protein